jgi:carbon-monoxide dehydrogenase small subunit
MTNAIKFSLNGRPVKIETDGERMLLWVLRTDFGLTGTKYGCGEGVCGTCTVLADNEAVLSCQRSVKEFEGSSIVTIEGLAQNGVLHPIQEAFVEHEAFQCGYCTPGMILRAHGLLAQIPNPSKEQIVDGMENNVCRCGAYNRIVRAVQSVTSSKGGEVKT